MHDGRSQEATRARTRNSRARAQGRATRQSAVDASWRIRPGRDGAHSRRQTWRSLNKTGDRDWLIESQTRWRQAARAQRRRDHGSDAQASQARHPARTIRRFGNTVYQTLTCGIARAEEGGPIGGLTRRSCQARKERRSKALARRQIPAGETCGTYAASEPRIESKFEMRGRQRRRSHTPAD